MTILCCGDSNTFGYDPRSLIGDRYERPWPEILGELTGWNVQNNGMCGRRVPMSDTVFSTNADRFLVMLGTNDLLSGDEPRMIAKRMELFLCRQERSKCILLAPPPLCRGEWVTDDGLINRCEALAGEYLKIAENLRIPFLDPRDWDIPLCFDGVHFTEDGHRIFAEHIARELK